MNCGLASAAYPECIIVSDSTPSRSLSIDEVSVGATVRQQFVFEVEQLQLFKELANDRAPIHHDPEFAQRTGFDAPIVQGLALATRFSRLVGMYLPGERAILEKIELKYKAPVFAREPLLYHCTVARVLRAMKVVQLTLGISVDGVDRVTGQGQCLIR